jgi:hypothetical protein
MIFVKTFTHDRKTSTSMLLKGSVTRCLAVDCQLLLHSTWLPRLPQRLGRRISTTQPCLRKKSKGQRPPPINTLRLQESGFERSQIGVVTGHQPCTSSGNVNTDLNVFLTTINRRLEFLLYSVSLRSQVGADALTEAEYEAVVMRFRDAVMSNLAGRMEDGNFGEAPSKVPKPIDLYDAYAKEHIAGLDPLIQKYFKQYFIGHGHPSIKKIDINSAITAADMRNPGEWYPGARSLRRKVIMHVGPTNSGKTYQALKRLETAKRGWYGGPLRLLAHEIFNRMNSKGINCNLRTGEEIRIVDNNAPLTASTIEMFSEANDYDVAVIDEIQMIADPQRGYAWTTALLGLKAKEIHLCGEEAAVPLVTRIVEELGEEIEVKRYERLTPLTPESEPIWHYKNVRAGDCVVAFSRKAMFNIKEHIELSTGLKCALVYGSLPPETRAMQADLFNDPNSDYKVIVATDAIGMGLNLYASLFIFNLTLIQGISKGWFLRRWKNSMQVV